MRIPKSVNVFGATYSIRRVKDLNEGEDDGHCNVVKKEIAIDSKLKGRELAETFYHELFHAVSYETGIYQAIEKELEEIIVTNFSKMISLLKK
jgi:hypothetical protein